MSGKNCNELEKEVEFWNEPASHTLLQKWKFSNFLNKTQMLWKNCFNIVEVQNF